MSDVDIEHLRDWIGRTEAQTDVVTSALVARFEATLGNSTLRIAGEAPLAIHWCLAPAAVPPEDIGPDGHPARGGFLPPVPLPRRMWAGGALEFHDAIRIGDEVTRTSRISDVALKVGRSGPLVFVTVAHEIATARGIAVEERQDIVYREMGAPGATPPPTEEEAECSEQVEASPVLLFRYSALTFNGHRIHYDRDHARDAEGYPGLVVHGPLQATLLAHLAGRFRSGRVPRRFDYRGVSPLFDGPAFSINARSGDGDAVELWCANEAGVPTMRATATF